MFGSVKGVYGSCVGCQCWCYARVQVWKILVLWDLVQWLRVGRVMGVIVCVWFSLCGAIECRKGIFEHPQ